MAQKLQLPEPPIQSEDFAEWQQWFQKLFARLRVLKSKVSSSADVDATVAPNVSYHGVTSLSAPRTLTLPAVANLEDGHRLVV